MDAIVFPDFRGTGVTSGFPEQLHRHAEAVVVAALNGPDQDELDCASLLAAGLADVETVRCERPGFNEAVLTGLEHAWRLGADKVVRLDTAEHPPQLLPEAFTALDDADVVVFDLVFDEETLRRQSADEYHNNFVMPALTRAATGGQLSLSGAHGYMAFRAEALPELIAGVRRALRTAGQVRGADVAWAGDTALVLLAARAGMRVVVREVPAVVLRDRPSAKCAAQLFDTLDLIAALPPLS